MIRQPRNSPIARCAFFFRFRAFRGDNHSVVQVIVPGSLQLRHLFDHADTSGTTPAKRVFVIIKRRNVELARGKRQSAWRLSVLVR